MDTARLRPASKLVAAGRPAPTPGAPVNTPISVSATYNVGGELTYARSGTETTGALEAAIGAVEGGTSVAFGSGVAATQAVLDGLPVGSRVLVPSSFYNFHINVLAEHERLGRLSFGRVDTNDVDAVADAVRDCAVLWLEIPSNPMLRVPDLPRLTELARAAGALSVVDATVATPLGLRPLEYGADISMHSATKSISGHADALLGVLTAGSAELADTLLQRRTLTGAVPGTLEAFLALRGLRTLSVRRERAQANAGELVRRLLRDPRVSRVHYPGDPDHPDHEVAIRLLDGAGSLFSFEITGTISDALAVCNRTELIAHATSLGGVETLIEPRGRYQGEMDQHTPPGLLRLSVGIEDVEDLWDDLDRALSD